MVEVVMIAKPGVSELVTACAANEITFGETCEQVAAMGYKTTSLYEMVKAAEAARADFMIKRAIWAPTGAF